MLLTGVPVDLWFSSITCPLVLAVFSALKTLNALTLLVQNVISLRASVCLFVPLTLTCLPLRLLTSQLL